MKLLQGGEGSGNFDHGGRPGLVGGSTTTINIDVKLEREQWYSIQNTYHPDENGLYALEHYIGGGTRGL